jgi:hypothetical protein
MTVLLSDPEVYDEPEGRLRLGRRRSIALQFERRVHGERAMGAAAPEREGHGRLDRVGARRGSSSTTVTQRTGRAPPFDFQANLGMSGNRSKCASRV